MTSSSANSTLLKGKRSDAYQGSYHSHISSAVGILFIKFLSMKSMETREEIVRRNFADIVQRVKIMPVLDHLYAERVADEEQYQRVQSKATEQDKAREVIIEILPKQGESAYEAFVVALYETNQLHLISNLQLRKMQFLLSLY